MDAGTSTCGRLDEPWRRAADLEQSRRRALLQDVGIPKTVEYAKAMGVGDVPSVPSLALGSGEVTLQSMTAAYAAFANHGIVPKPVLIRRVEDRDKTVLFAADEAGSRAITDVTAYLMANMMADVINAGTAARARALGFTLPAAGRPGRPTTTTSAWFVGFTPSRGRSLGGLSTSRTPSCPAALPPKWRCRVWASFMKSATSGAKPEWLQMPAGIVTANVCRMSGKLATEGCEHADVIDDKGHLVQRSMVYTEYFAKGTQPTTTCDIHASRGIFGSIAAVFNGGSEKPPVPHVEDTSLPPATAATSGITEPTANAQKAEEPQKKKRGFWSRVFGVGRDESDRNREKDRNR